VKSTELADSIIDAVRNQRRLKMLDDRENYKYCPHPLTWLNRGGWEDELPDEKPEPIKEPKRIIEVRV
jgi:hypothetical protein